MLVSFRGALCALAAVALAAPIAQAQEKKTLLIAEPGHNLGYLPLYVAMRKGFFAEENLDVRSLTMDGGGAHTNAVLTGQAFAFIGGPEHNAFAKLKGADLRAVANVVDRGNVYFMARKGGEPAADADVAGFVRGKRVATGYFGGTPNSITRYMMKKWGIDLKNDVTLSEMSTGSTAAAVKANGADIGVVGEPIVTQGIRAGAWGEPFVNIPKLLGPYAYSTINVRLASIQNDSDTVGRFVRAVSRGMEATYANPAEAAQIARKEFPTMAEEDLKATIDRSFADEIWSRDGRIVPQEWTTAQSVVREAGVLKQDVPFDHIIDMRYFDLKKAER